MRKFIFLVTLVLLLLSIFSFVSCVSGDNPLPEKYAGLYGSGQYGSLKVTTTTVSTDELLLPVCVVGGTTVTSEVVMWEPVSFNYNKNMTFDFEAYVQSIISSVKGTASFSGYFAENANTYDIHLKYYQNNEIWFAKSR